MKTIPSATLSAAGTDYRIIDLPALAGPVLPQLPWVLRLLLENVARNMQGSERDSAVASILGWVKQDHADAEIEFQPGRLLMHDTTSTPALVDVAGMRDALAEAGVDPQVLNPLIPVDVSIDHSLAVEAYARRDAVEFNEALEIRRNRERYRFLRWASLAMDNVRLHPPGTGIMHTINLEQLATVVTTEIRDGVLWAVPDMMLGTDSHTPMINGIGVLGWGIGGLEAQTVMFGIATPLRIPDVVGVRLTGRLGDGVQASDLALVVTHQLRELDVTGDFVEFFGPGVSTLSAEDRAVVANMAPEYGATTGYFPPDARVPEYLRKTGWSRLICSATASISMPMPRHATHGASKLTFPPSPCMPPDRAGRRTCSTAPGYDRRCRNLISNRKIPPRACRGIRSHSQRSPVAPIPRIHGCWLPPVWSHARHARWA